jgi:hypothetical protein
MKTRIFQIIATLFLLFALPILFSSCESDMTDVAASEEIDMKCFYTRYHRQPHTESL